MIAIVLALVVASAEEPSFCRDPFPRDESPREEVLEQCRVIGTNPDGSDVLDPEDCFVVYREDSRYSVEYHGKVLGADYVRPPDFRTATKNPEETIIVGKFGGGWLEIILPGHGSVGTFDMNQIVDIGTGRFAYSRDYRHIAFVEHREDGTYHANVDGQATRIRGPVDVVTNIRFDPSGFAVQFTYLSGSTEHTVVLPTRAPSVVIMR
jgi:hypothetical protein